MGDDSTATKTPSAFATISTAFLDVLLLKDEYDRHARLAPALIAALPMGVAIGFVMHVPNEHTYVRAALFALASAAMSLVLAYLGRTSGSLFDAVDRSEEWFVESALQKTAEPDSKSAAATPAREKSAGAAQAAPAPENVGFWQALKLLTERLSTNGVWARFWAFPAIFVAARLRRRPTHILMPAERWLCDGDNERSSKQCQQWKLAAEKLTGVSLTGIGPESSPNARKLARDVFTQLTIRLTDRTRTGAEQPASLVFKQLSEYGFARNLSGLYWFWWLSSFFGLLLAWRFGSHPLLNSAVFWVELAQLALACSMGIYLPWFRHITRVRLSEAVLDRAVIVANIQPHHP